MSEIKLTICPNKPETLTLAPISEIHGLWKEKKDQSKK